MARSGGKALTPRCSAGRNEDSVKIPGFWHFLVSRNPAGIFAQNLPLWSLRPSRTVGMTKIPKMPGLVHYFFAGITGIFPQNPAPKRLRPALPRCLRPKSADSKLTPIGAARSTARERQLHANTPTGVARSARKAMTPSRLRPKRPDSKLTAFDQKGLYTS